MLDSNVCINSYRKKSFSTCVTDTASPDSKPIPTVTVIDDIYTNTPMAVTPGMHSLRDFEE